MFLYGNNQSSTVTFLVLPGFCFRLAIDRLGNAVFGRPAKKRALYKHCQVHLDPTPCFLIIALHVFGHLIMNDITYIGLSIPIPKAFVATIMEASSFKKRSCPDCRSISPSPACYCATDTPLFWRMSWTWSTAFRVAA